MKGQHGFDHAALFSMKMGLRKVEKDRLLFSIDGLHFDGYALESWNCMDLALCVLFPNQGFLLRINKFLITLCHNSL